MTPTETILAAKAHADRDRPALAYEPGSEARYPDPLDRYQEQFHRSTHTVRALILGNGSGKTTTVGVEIDWWARGNHPFRDTPARAVQMWWVCQKFQQFQELRPQLDRRCFGTGWAWNANANRYTWPNGSTLTIFSNDGSWEGAQGPNPDLIAVDEECDPALWRELTMRRRGDRKTEYVIAATATKGKRWMYHEIYTPWLTHHAALGLDERQAMRRQSHSDYWVWPKGGLLDNPANDAKDEAWYRLALANAPPAEQEVRLRGGFVDLNQSPVFDHAALLEMERAIIPGIAGVLVDNEGYTGDPVVQYDGGYVRRAAMPEARRRFEFIPTGGEWEGGRLTIYEQPTPDGLYVIGADFAQGLQTGDADAAIVCRTDGDRIVQVAELHGRLGQTTFPPMLLALGWYFNEALVVGEANSMGLGNLRWLWESGYVYQYLREQKQDAKATPKTDRLGYWKGSPLPINYLQWAISPRAAPDPARKPSRVVVRSSHALEELRKYSYKPRTKTADLAGHPDERLVMEAESGYHDDLVSALAGCVVGWRELPRFVRPPPAFPGGSLGDRLGHAAVLAKTAPKVGAFTYAKR